MSVRLRDALGLRDNDAPFPWQEELLSCFKQEKIPSSLDIPTGLGKTAVIAIWLVARASGAKLPRRLVYVVDRRAVVDQATEVAVGLRDFVNREPDVQQTLGLDGRRSLPISTLRGQYIDKKEWLEDPALPAIIVGTVDMIGSRLLFEGYAVTRKMRPYQAGLLSVDTLVVLDESHLVPPFERLLEQIAEKTKTKEFGPKEETDREIIPRFYLLPLSATGRDRDGDVVRLTEEDRKHPIVKQRLTAKKRLTFCPADDKKLEQQLAEEAWGLTDNGTSPMRILVYCNSRDAAEKVKGEVEKLAKKAKVDIEEPELFVGARRVKEREDAMARLKDLGFFSGNNRPAYAAFVVATSAGEVGVDLDADHVVMDLVPFERMVQRLGRVNRLGGEKREAKAQVVGDPDKSLLNDLKNRAERCRNLLQKLPRHEDGSHDASSGALTDLKRGHKDDIEAASSPEPLYPALTRPLLDAWSMTSLKEHTGRPEVQPWLRGWVENDPPQTTLVWRKSLPVRLSGGEASSQEINEFFAAAPPHLTEMLETETLRVRDWLLARATKLVENLARVDQHDAGEGLDLPRFSENSIICIALGRAGEEKQYYTLARLIELGEGKNALNQALGGATLILDARLGGLRDGLLDANADVAMVSAADGEDGWFDPETKEPLAPFRVRPVKLGQNDSSFENETGLVKEGDANWRPIHAFDVERDAEDKPLLQLVVEKWRGEAPDEDARSVSARPQSLKDHQMWAERRARRLVERLGLDERLGKAIVLAARLHDEGKQAVRWQNAFRTSRNGRPYAKTASKRPPDFQILGGYRHELGSLFHIERDSEFETLPDDLKDLVLHLVAAHHGRARPVIETAGCEEAPPSVLEGCARDVALRFARLQKRFGPWGLAWLEAILRAADQQASRDLDEGRTSDG